MGGECVFASPVSTKGEVVVRDRDGETCHSALEATQKECPSAGTQVGSASDEASSRAWVESSTRVSHPHHLLHRHRHRPPSYP